MLKRLYRQRRRLILLAALLTLSVVITHWGSADLRYEIKHGEMSEPAGGLWAASAAGVLFLMLCAVAIVLVFPSARRVVETGGMALFLTEAIKSAQFILPAWALEGIAPWIWYLVFFYAISIMLERDVLFRSGVSLPFRSTQTRLINAPPDGVWAAIAPSAETLGTYWTGALAQVEARPDLGPASVNVRYHMGPPLSFVQTQTRRIWDRPFHMLYDFKPEDLADTEPGTRGSFEMRCVRQEDGRSRVTTTHSYPGLGLGTWSLLWLDDMTGSEMDAIAARLEGRRDRSMAGWAARKMAGA